MRGTVATVLPYLLVVACCYGMDIHTQDSLAPLLKQCVVADSYLSPYVRAFRTRRALVAGCEAERSPPSAREVHVLNVLQPVVRVDGHPPHVHVHLEPASRTGIHQGPLVVILVAPSPVVWRVSSQRLSNASRIVFWIEPGSGSRVEKLNQLRHKVKQEQLPGGREELLRWVTAKYHALTSYTETLHVNSYLRRVGTASPTARQGTSRCEPVADFESRNLEVKYLDQRPTHACSVAKNEGIMTKDIHVIEMVAETNSSTPGPNPVLVDVSMVTRAARRRHLLLLLKANRDITWKIRTSGMRGDLDIIAHINNRVDTDVDPKQTVRVTMEQLTDYSGATLRQWAINKEGPLVSYTRTAGADTIKLVMDGNADGRSSDSRPGGRRSDGRTQDDQHIPGQDDLPFINRSPFLTPAKTRAALNRAKHVHCTSRSMEVLLRKTILRLHGIRKEHLSLLQPECMAASNRTHFILHTEFNTCGTKGHESSGSVAYQNAILLHDVDLSEVKDDLGSADLSELRSLMASSDLTRVDDEDYSAVTDADGQIRVDFRCDYTIGDQDHSIQPEEIDLGPVQPAPQVGDRQFKLVVYKDMQYQEVLTSWPLRFHPNDVVYIQAQMTGDTHLHLIVENCWLGPTRFHDPIGHTLIDRGCEKGADVQILQNSPTQVRFSFLYKEPLTASKGFVGCQLAVCASDESARAEGIPLCTPRSCIQAQPQPPRIKALKTAFTGPLDPPRREVWDNSPDRGNETPQGVDGAHDSAQKCQEVIRVEGLDSGTVVGISFAAFIIGVLLTAALWVIHTHTGPYRQANRPRSTETSGESTPSSTAPITIHHIHT